jgi:hypothetical protein
VPMLFTARIVEGEAGVAGVAIVAEIAAAITAVEAGDLGAEAAAEVGAVVDKGGARCTRLYMPKRYNARFAKYLI